MLFNFPFRRAHFKIIVRSVKNKTFLSFRYSTLHHLTGQLNAVIFNDTFLQPTFFSLFANSKNLTRKYCFLIFHFAAPISKSIMNKIILVSSTLYHLTTRRWPIKRRYVLNDIFFAELAFHFIRRITVRDVNYSRDAVAVHFSTWFLRCWLIVRRRV